MLDPKHQTSLSLIAAAAIGGGLIFAAHAEPLGTAAKPTPQPPTNEAKPSAAAPDPETRKKMALKLAGLVAFVANSCPQLKPDYGRFKAALVIFGTSVEALEKPDMKTGYLAYTTQYRSDVSGNCTRAEQQFGPAGATIKGLFAPAPQPPKRP